MKVKQLMERCQSVETGKIIAYIKDGLEEINILAETHTDAQRINIVSGKRFYKFPNNMIKVLDIRMKNHRNAKDEYRSIPRMLHKPVIKDDDEI